MRDNILSAVVIRFQICIFDILNTASIYLGVNIEQL